MSYIMFKDKPVFQFNIDTGDMKVINEALLPYELKKVGFKNETFSDYQKNYNFLIGYLSDRVLNLSRENAKKLLNAYGFSQSQSDQQKARIAIACKGVSMIDDYWINTDDLKFKWENINLRENSLNKIVSHIALTGSSLTIKGIPHTPEISGQGAYAKAWIRENDKIYLYKKGSSEGKYREGRFDESKIEVSVSNILDCTNVPHVKYIPGEFEGEFVSKCECMTTDDRYIVAADVIESYCNRCETTFLDFTKKLDSENFYKMLIVDYLISNSDRHNRNWGFFVDSNTNKVTGLHYLFDNNNAFNEKDIEDKEGGPNLVLSNRNKAVTKKEAALYAIKRCDFKIIKDITPDLFLSEKHYKSFMDRAVELGIYQIKNKKYIVQDKHLGSIEELIAANTTKENNKNIETSLER